MKFKYNIKINTKDKNSSHNKIITAIGKDKRVLEFGCSTGYMSQILQQHGCEVTGIEIDKNAAQVAKKYCKDIIIGDIEKLSYNVYFKKNSFDAIVFADVLEHLKNPKKTLLKVKDFLKNDGKLILSIPNIAHASIRLELLTGNFEYEKYGILDDTHLKYFTKKSIARLLNDCGYYIEIVDAAIKYVTPYTIDHYLEKIGIRPTRSIRTYFHQIDSLAYQYIIVASLNKPSRQSLEKVFKPVKILNYTELEVENYRKEIENYRKEIENYRKEIEKLTNTRGWKIISFFHGIRMKIPILKNL